MASAAAEYDSGMVAVTAAAAGHQVIKAEFGGKMLAANVLAEGVVVYAGLSSHCAQLVAFCDEFMRRGQVRDMSLPPMKNCNIIKSGTGKGDSRCGRGRFPHPNDAGARQHQHRHMLCQALCRA